MPLFKSLPFDPVKDFAPISPIGTFDCLFIVNAGSPYKTLADWVKAARDKPGTLNVGTITAGSTQHLTAELFKSTAEPEFRHRAVQDLGRGGGRRCCATTSTW